MAGRAVDSGVLSTTQSRVLQAISDFWMNQGYSPSMRDIARHCNLHFSTVAYQVGELEAAGRIVRTRGVARSLRVVQQP